MTSYKWDYGGLTSCIAAVVAQAQADILFIQELKSGADAFGYLDLLQQQLRALSAPMNNWYYDWIKGSLAGSAGEPWATSRDLDWDAAHNEGYAVFWNQNLAKFTVQAAPPVPAPGGGVVRNVQSQTVRTVGTMLGAPVSLWGIHVPAPVASSTEGAGPLTSNLPPGVAGPVRDRASSSSPPTRPAGWRQPANGSAFWWHTVPGGGSTPVTK